MLVLLYFFLKFASLKNKHEVNAIKQIYKYNYIH